MHTPFDTITTPYTMKLVKFLCGTPAKQEFSEEQLLPQRSSIKWAMRGLLAVFFFASTHTPALAAQPTYQSEMAEKVTEAIAKKGKTYGDDLIQLRKDYIEELKKLAPNLKENGSIFKRIVDQALFAALKPLAENAAKEDVDPAKDQSLFDRIVKEHQSRLATESGIAPPLSGQVTETVKKEAQMPDVGFLREYGMSLTAGYGMVPDESELMPTFQFRYNFLQRSVNQFARMSENNQDKVVTGQQVEGFKSFVYGTFGEIDKRRGISPRVISGMSLWLGWTPEELQMSQGGARKRPFLAGVSIGLGLLKEGGAIVNLDAGYTLMDGGRFGPDNHPYFGVSIDGALFQRIAGAIANMDIGKLTNP